MQSAAALVWPLVNQQFNRPPRDHKQRRVGRGAEKTEPSAIGTGFESADGDPQERGYYFRRRIEAKAPTASNASVAGSGIRVTYCASTPASTRTNELPTGSYVNTPVLAVMM